MNKLLIQRFRTYWRVRNGKFKDQLKPTIKFLAHHLRKTIPRGKVEVKIVGDSSDNR
jgi:hypothetical protein